MVLSVLFILTYRKQHDNDILYYYKHDSLKYEAAKFLIDNMHYHYSLDNIVADSEEWERWRLETDSILKGLLCSYPYDGIPRDTIKAIQAQRDTLLATKNLPEIATVDSIALDSTFLTADFLIQHIDNAFEVWRTNKYAKGLTFDEF